MNSLNERVKNIEEALIFLVGMMAEPHSPLFRMIGSNNYPYDFRTLEALTELRDRVENDIDERNKKND